MTTVLGRGVFYGWIIVAVSFVITFLTYGVQFSFGVFLDPLQKEFGWTRAAISLVPGLFILSQCIFGLVAGWYTDRYSPRIIVGIGGFFVGLGLVLTSRISAPWELYIYYSLMVGFGVGCCGTPIFTTVSRWFLSRRGLALGITATAVGLGTMIMAPIAQSLISAYGPKTPYLILGCFSLTMVVAALWLKRQPEDMGELPYGATNDQLSSIPSIQPRELTLSQALRTGTLWLLFLMLILANMSLMMILYHLVTYAKETGIPEMTAATLLSVAGGTNILGKIVVGIASDKYGRKPLFVICFLIQAAMIIWLIKSTSSWMFYVFATIWGLGYGGWMPLMPAIVGDLFGLRHMGSVLGVAGLSLGVGGTIGPIMAGYIVDSTGCYSPALLAGSLAMFMAAAIVPLLKTPTGHYNTS